VPQKLFCNDACYKYIECLWPLGTSAAAADSLFDLTILPLQLDVLAKLSLYVGRQLRFVDTSGRAKVYTSLLVNVFSIPCMQPHICVQAFCYPSQFRC